MKVTVHHLATILSLLLPVGSTYIGRWGLQFGSFRTLISVGGEESDKEFESPYKNATDPHCQTRIDQTIDLTLTTATNLMVFTLCTVKNQYPLDCRWDDMEVLDQNDNDCPTTDTGVVERLYRKAQKGDVLFGLKNKNPTIDDIWEGLHRLDSETFPSKTPPKEVLELVNKPEGEVGGSPTNAPAGGKDDEKIPLAGIADMVDSPKEDSRVEEVPGRTQDGIAKDCKKWYLVKEGDSCDSVSKSNGIEVKKLYAWNPALNEGGECMELWIGYAVCVGTSAA